MTLPARQVPVWCPTCTAVTLHLLASCTVTCQYCHTARVVGEPVEVAAAAIGEPLPAVRDMRFCPWCRETKAADHVCPAGAVGSATQTEALYGSPSDIDNPQEWS